MPFVRWIALSVSLVGLFTARAQSLRVPLDRIRPPLDAIEQALASSTDDDALVASLLQRDTRKNLFRLEGLMRIYEDFFDRSFEEQATTIHDFSHRLGNYADSVAAVKVAGEVGAPAALVSFLKDKENEERAAFARYLHENWLGPESPALVRLRETLQTADWSGEFPSYRDDRENALSTLGHRLKLVTNHSYDLDVLEGDNGIHKLRRELRWFSITAGSLDGMITLTDDRGCPIPRYESLSSDPNLTNSPHAQLAGSEHEIACRLPRCLYLAVVQAVEDLGTAKDIGQYQIFLAEAAQADGLASTKAQARQMAADWIRNAKIAREHPDFLDFRRKAKEIYRSLIDSNLFSVLRKSIKACRAG